MSAQVASQTNNLPFDQETMVIPLGCLPSARSRPVGSSREGTLAEDKALCRMSFIMAWRKWRPALKRQLSPCVPSVSTSVTCLFVQIACIVAFPITSQILWINLLAKQIGIVYGRCQIQKVVCTEAIIKIHK